MARLEAALQLVERHSPLVEVRPLALSCFGAHVGAFGGWGVLVAGAFPRRSVRFFMLECKLAGIAGIFSRAAFSIMSKLKCQALKVLMPT